SIVGGQLGAGLGRRLPPSVLRTIIIVGGLAAVAKLLL
ncbi:MAG TPA: sulfite exporter TauE/SafE family protein, partial [Candidatus Dormibacteraeota bacterium]